MIAEDSWGKPDEVPLVILFLPSPAPKCYTSFPSAQQAAIMKLISHMNISSIVLQKGFDPNQGSPPAPVVGNENGCSSEQAWAIHQ